MLNEFYVKLIEAETWFFGQYILNEPLMQLVVVALNIYILMATFAIVFVAPLHYIWVGICKWLGWEREIDYDD